MALKTQIATTHNPSVAVIGSGYWGKNLVRNFNQLGALKLICDKSDDLLSEFREQYPSVSTCLSLSDVLGQKDIDGLVIATPAETHYLIAREALLSGKHVYVEKPLSLDEREGEELAALAEEKGLVLMVGHLLQYHPVFVRLKELAANGALGRINSSTRSVCVLRSSCPPKLFTSHCVLRRTRLAKAGLCVGGSRASSIQHITSTYHYPNKRPNRRKKGAQ